MMRRALLAVPMFVIGLLVGSCSPAQREVVREVAPPLTRAICVLLHAFTQSGTIEEVCATAEELAPFVPEILAQREARGTGGAIASSPGVVELAFSLPPPPRPVPRRRCVSWVDLRDAGVSDGGGDE